MVHYEHLWLFFAVVFGVVILPGLDMAFVLASSLVGGRRLGFAAVAGIIAGGVCHVVVGVLGVSVILKIAPGAFNTLLIIGSVYMVWIGFTLTRATAGLTPAATERAVSPAKTFRRAAFTNLANPKAYLFMLAVFPQFLRLEYGPIAIQAVTLEAIIALTQASVYGTIALVAARAHGWLGSKPKAAMTIHKIVGIVLILAAFVTGVSGWRSM